MPSVTELDTRTIGDAVQAVRGLKPSRGYVRTYAAGRVEISIGAREAYSYGRHFPLFRYVRPARGLRNGLFVINGDVWRNGGGPSRTGDHQAAARDAIGRTGLPSIVLPFSALDGAGIDIDSVRPLHVRPDETFTETLERRTIEEVPKWRRMVTDRIPQESARATPDIPRTYRNATDEERRAHGWEGYGRYPILPDADGIYRWTVSVERDISPDADGIYRWTEDRHRLGDSLFTAVRAGRRSRYLSSFDTNEAPPLYFLCEVPARGVPATVEAAIDSLAPRAVHAAILAGREVRRQGDIFLVDTELTTGELASRGAVFGRLTQWSRSAKPRRGEVTFREPNRDRDGRIAAKELRYARRLWRERFPANLESAVTAHIPDATLRAERLADPLARAIPTGDYAADRDLVRFRHATVHHRAVSLPSSPRGSRRRWAKIRADRERAIASARADLRRATLTGLAPRGYGFGGKSWNEGETEYRRRLCRQAVESARSNLDRALASGTDGNGHMHSRHARDLYRARYGNNALALWNRCKYDAQCKYRPETVADMERARRNREKVRAHLAVYGTAHSATEVARVGSAVYVRGTVRHAVDLEPNRRGGPDHRPIVLSAGRWYLAVRNTVPRQNRRRSVARDA